MIKTGKVYKRADRQLEILSAVGGQGDLLIILTGLLEDIATLPTNGSYTSDAVATKLQWQVTETIDGQSRQIGRFTVTAKEWKKSNQHRIYFSFDSSAQACYDMNEEVFIKCRGRVGARMEHAIKEVFKL